MALVNGTQLIPLQKQGDWLLVAPACDLTPTWAWSGHGTLVSHSKASSPKATSLIASQLLGQVDDLMSVHTEDHLLLTRQLDDEFQFLAGRMHQLDSHIAPDLGNFSEIATQETKAQQVERSR